MRNPISVQIVGGLGNQLYGLSAGVVIAHHLQRELELDYGLVRFGANLSRSPEIEKIQLGFLTDQFSSKNSQKFFFRFLYEKLRRRLNHTLPSVLSDRIIPNIVSEKEPDYSDTMESVSVQLNQIPIEARTIGGYFTNFEWANRAIEKGFPSDLNPLNPSATYQDYEKKVSTHSIALHIRLGDYLWFPERFPILDENYYFEALKLIDYNFSDPIHVFTDSADMVAERYPNLIDLPNTLVIDKFNEMDAVETMALMSKHRRIVISNSTFSSWAAWFSHSDAVVTPVPHHMNEWQDTLPTSWKRIDIQS